MVEGTSLKFRLRKIGETRNCFLDEVKHNDVINEKYKKTCKYLNYVKNLLILASVITGCISTSAFASLVGALVGITISAVGINIGTILQELKSICQLLRKR